MQGLLQKISESIILGKRDKHSEFYPELMGQPGVVELVELALEQGIDVNDILTHGLLEGMDIVGERFKNDEMFVPEVMIAADSFKAGMDLIRPLISKGSEKQNQKIVLGTVKGDLHDIGKNLVSMMMQGANFTVIDLGTDISAEKFITAIKNEKPQLLGLSALLTTTMAEMKNTITAVAEAGLRDQVKIMVGGAPVTQEYANFIGADGFAPDAVMAVEKAKQLLGIN